MDLTQSDHDVLIEIKTLQKVMSDDIRKLQDGTTRTMADHEHRLKFLENYKGVIVTNTALLWGAWGILLTVIILHIFGVKP